LAASVLYLLRVMADSGKPHSSRGAPVRGGGFLLMSLGVAACGGAAPLLHPAHALPVNTVSAGAGVSGQFASGGVGAAIDSGRSAAAQPLDAPAQARAYAAGVLAKALVGPGASPWVAARVGLPENLEAGLTYTGRSIRLDGRYVSRLTDTWALSLGLGGTALLFSPDSTALGQGPGLEAPAAGEAEFNLDATGWGADLPLLIGYESFGGFVEVWGGVRVGYEALSGELLANVQDPASPRMDASGHRLWAAGLAGLSLGVPPIWFRFELSTTAHRLSGEVEAAGPDADRWSARASLTAWTFTPSGALVGKF
jgi:hypothetical protein